MKITCSKCGAQNELGRVFCSSCGQRLDLTQHTAASEFQGSEAPKIPPVIWKVLIAVIVLVVAGTVLLGFWPAAAKGGEMGDRAAAAKVRNRLATVRKAMQGRDKTRTESFFEREINSYLEEKRIEDAAKTGPGRLTAKVTVLLGESGVAVHIDEPVTLPFTVPGLGSNQFPSSYDLTCAIVGGRLVLTSARVGHLPLVGPLRSMALNKALPALAELGKDKEGRDLLSAVKEIKVEKGRAEIRFLQE